jgi:hypothetical protein
MSREDRVALPRFAHVRRTFWALLGGAVLLALLAPGVILWHAASTRLQAQTCLWPPSPRAGEPERLFVVLYDTSDRAAMQGPWAQVVVTWDMVSMPMGTHPLAVPGQRGNAGVFSVPLRLDMGGQWWAHIVLQTPGRPVWEASLQFMVLPAGPSGSDAATQLSGNALFACRATERSASA